MCNGGEDFDRSLPLLSGVSDHNWIRFPVHHGGVSCCDCPAHLSAGHHHGDGDFHHWNLPRKGTTMLPYTVLHQLIGQLFNQISVNRNDQTDAEYQSLQWCV